MKKAIVLLSGGLDSTTVLFLAKSKGFKPECLIFDYGQRHRKEIDRAKRVARFAKAGYQLVKFDLPWKGSSLLDQSARLPARKTIDPRKIPSTYVPARNIIFLSFAVSFAEAVKAGTVFIGANAIDYSGYPDCRPEFIKNFQAAVRKGMKSGVEGRGINIEAPLVRKTKTQIIKMGMTLKAPYHLTWSCYRGGKVPCGKCESCVLRARGFAMAGFDDPARGWKE